ncbi:MAG: hypothetical protein ABIT01_11200, partial [Thermoanaerobaculia bacterium]
MTKSERPFGVATFAIIGFFLILEVVYAFLLPRVMDEFTTTHDVYRVSHLLPYREFRPPKTVLAYYVELPPMLLFRGNWSAMTGIKVELALLWAAALALAATVLRRDLEERAVVAALAVTVIMSTFAERATEVRVDPVAALFGLTSLLALIRRRPGLAGVLCAA